MYISHLTLVTLGLSLLSPVLGDDVPCDVSNPCVEGCCSKDSKVCGYGPAYCASDKCIAEGSVNGTCAQKSECDPGVFPRWGDKWGSDYAMSEHCPLNVCCSEFGFCGTTEDFCGDSTVTQPSCSGTSSTKRTIGYYEGWNHERACDTMPPEDVAVGGYTHIFFAFLYIDPDSYTIAPMKADQQDLYSRIVALKERKPGLEVWISIGGWDFNDPGATRTTFSDLAASFTKQTAFFQSLISFLEKYGFDGVDLDWEYPVASERGGRAADFDNYVTFLENLREALSGSGKKYGLTITLPSSYWYMQHFDVKNLVKSVDWFNIMTYDLHGTWDANSKWIGSIVNAHTNLTEIKLSMDLLWRNDIDPDKVVMGLGFYGRSFTLSDTSCTTAGCPFSSAGNPGRCTNSAGTLSFTEIKAVLDDESSKATKYYDEDAAVQIVTFDTNQWVSYDDHQSFEAKINYANSHCIGGTMVWAVSLDVSGNAVNGLTGATNLFPDDDGSNGGENDIYIGPDLWTNATASVACNAPCTLILPPRPLETPMTITWPPHTTSLLSSSDGSIYTKTTTFQFPPFALTEIPFWAETISSSDDMTAYFSPMQSIAPPSMVVSLPGTEAPFPVTSVDYTGRVTGGGSPTQTVTATTSAVSTPAAVQSGIVDNCVKFYKTVANDGCYDIAIAHDITPDQFLEWNPAVKADCSGLWVDEYYCIAVAPKSATTSSTTTTTAPVFYSTSHSVTLTAQPTVTSIEPKDTPIPQIIYTRGHPPSSGGCSAGNPLKGCGSHNCGIFGCSGHCGMFGCDGGCGLKFCGGGCGPGGCGPGCGTPGGCLIEGGGGGTSDGDNGDDDDNNDDDDDKSTTSCTETATPTTTTACDTACSAATDSACATICDTITVSLCTTTPAGGLQIEAMGSESWDWISETDEELDKEAAAFASFINPYLTSMDPILVSGTTFTGSAPRPTAPPSTTTKTTSTTTKDPSTSSTLGYSTARPYPTMPPAERPYCFREHNDDNAYLSFDMDEYKDAYKSLCTGYKTMEPNDGAHTYISPKGLVAWAAYSTDQSGCAEASEWDFTQTCETWIQDLFQLCDQPIVHTEYYGGGFVQPGPNGCIEYYIGKAAGTES